MPNYRNTPTRSERLRLPLVPPSRSFIVPRARLADVVLGQPQANCRYHGICRIDDPVVPAPRGCQGHQVVGWLDWYTPRYCRLTIACNQLSGELEAYHFGAGSITLHRPQPLAQFWEHADARVRIVAGEYPVHCSGEAYLIGLKVR